MLTVKKNKRLYAIEEFLMHILRGIRKGILINNPEGITIYFIYIMNTVHKIN